MFCRHCQLPFDSASGVCPFCSSEQRPADRPLARNARHTHDALAHCPACGAGMLPGVSHVCAPRFDTSNVDLKH